MILSDHAKERMLKKGISEEEVRECVEHGSPQSTNCIRGEARYYKRLDLKDKSIVVIYTFKNDELRVITTYAIVDTWRE